MEGFFFISQPCSLDLKWTKTQWLGILFLNATLGLPNALKMYFNFLCLFESYFF